ncbi:carboxypeptidase-like regulatory domain-containing protein [Qipengyuania gaetbuli]|uniref:carboxypeptidase-like regulatory domain-containing protein n=1 Tax=Qipengyuania gaetbuli TaxID=266952 RepID=UPI001CD34AF1|nr:carboxypeptidase-like regulatory domain-containing protein [Qipengyuania gaetbuli]MCA0909266.1 hypothetical protein [Qipengyuania gaetbuli]
MSRRKIVGGAGTAILITAAVGYGLAPGDKTQRTKIPAPKRFDPQESGPSVSLRRPLPTPSFGTDDPASSKAGSPARKIRPKARLSGSGSDVPVLAQASLEEAAKKRPPAYTPLLPKAGAGQLPAEVSQEPAPGTQPVVSDDTAPPALAEAVAEDLPVPAFGTGPDQVDQQAEPAPVLAAAPEPADTDNAASGEVLAATAPASLEDEPLAAPLAPVPLDDQPVPTTSDGLTGEFVESFGTELPEEPSVTFRPETDAALPAADPEVAAPQQAPVPEQHSDGQVGAQELAERDEGAASYPSEELLAVEAPPAAPAPLAPPPPQAEPGTASPEAGELIAVAPAPAEELAPVAAKATPLAPPPQTAATAEQVPEYERLSFAPPTDRVAPPAAGTTSASQPAGPVAPASFVASPSPPVRSPVEAAEAPASYASLTSGLIKRGNAASASTPAQPAGVELTSAPGLRGAIAGDGPLISYQDELILEVRVNGASETDTIIAYGTRGGLYLPLGPIVRILDLAISVTDEGRYAQGWILDESRALTIDLRSGTIEAGGKTIKTDGVLAAPFDGELYLRADQYEALFPLTVKADLRTQSVLITTLEKFPFEERLDRMVRRAKLEAANGGSSRDDFERVVAPYRPLSIPTADVELRAVSDSTFGTRAEGDFYVAGDLGYLSAEGYFSGDTKNGPTASLFKVGRVDPDSRLLGPLEATAFSAGDINSASMAIGLRSVAGRGAMITNAPSQVGSVFDRVDLRGILPDGYEVELYRNDILVGSTRDAVNGQYEFLQIPVDFGLNVFRFVFFGPQGQRSEVVERISVGDGRLPEGKLVYSFDAAQRHRNLLGVRPPNYVEPVGFGDWRSSAQLSYGVTSGLTALAGAAWFEDEGEDRWLATTGLRTGLAGLAVKVDAGVADGGSYAFGGGVGGRFGRSSVTLSHMEYSGEFPDETLGLGNQFLRRATELDFNTAFNLGGEGSGITVPISARIRNYEGIDGRNTFSAGARASARTGGLLFSNTLDYSRTSGGGIAVFDQLFGNFDLATLSRSDTRGRLSLGYSVLPEVDLLNASLELDHRLDERTSIRGSAGYFFKPGQPAFGLSAAREFDTFTLAFDASYSFVDKSHFVGLRLGYSLGRDPLRGRVFMARPGLAASGGASLRAFRDLDGDGVYGPPDEPVEGVDFISFNRTGTTDDQGVAQLSGLGVGRAVTVQMDPTTLPDIDLAPKRKGIEIVPRPGTIQAIDFPIVALSEVEGTARFADAQGRGVSGVRLRLLNPKGEVISFAKTEVDGYFFFERVQPGRYTLAIDPDQISRLGLCELDGEAIVIDPQSSIVTRDLTIRQCD